MRRGIGERCDKCGAKLGLNKIQLVHGLTPRQWEYVNAVMDGLNGKGIAARLSVTVEAVKYQISAINKVWGTKGKLEIAERARSLNATPVEGLASAQIVSALFGPQVL
jgi:DNA-binding NarL/FixJ family response regulator